MYIRQLLRRLPLYLISASLAALLQASITSGCLAEEAKGIQAILELQSVFFTTSEPVEVRFSLWNPDTKDARSLPQPPLVRYFELVNADGQKLAPATVTLDAPRPPALPPGGHYGIAFDLSKLFPQLRSPGTYRLSWKSHELISNQVVLKIVSPYDPKKQYAASLETTMGTVKIEFFPDKPPLAVKNFIELAFSGFYDGTRIYYVDPDRMIAGGDRNGNGTGTPGYTYPVERNDLQMLAGTVGMKRGGAPPMNGSQFFILAAPRADFTGQYTAFAQVIDGLEVVQKISRVPNSGRQSDPPFQPLTDVIVNKVTISEKGAVGPAEKTAPAAAN